MVRVAAVVLSLFVIGGAYQVRALDVSRHAAAMELDEAEPHMQMPSAGAAGSPDVLRKLQEMDPEVERFAGYIATVSPAIFATYTLLGSLGCFLMFCFTCAFTACCTIALLPYEICTGGSCCPCLPCL